VRTGRRRLPARRPGDRRRLDQGLHLPGHPSSSDRPQARPPAALARARGGDRAGLRQLPEQIQRGARANAEIEDIAEEYIAARHNFLYLGRGYNFPVALEGALKLKEISYIHAEGYPAAEMKHGPIALIDEMMPVVFIAPHDAVFEKITSRTCTR
jgi:glucosamine 6-phosphate synthetase-like amidotransferase/phosphosugar isomerase protein